MEVNISKEKSVLSETAIDQMIDKLEEDCELDYHLPGGGYIHMSDLLPYLVVYRQEQNLEDTSTIRFILSEASFIIIGSKDFESYQNLIYKLSERISAKFKSFLILEVFSGQDDSYQFKIKGPSDKISTTLEEFQKELNKINKRFVEMHLQDPVVENTLERHPEHLPPLLPLQKLKESGALLLGLEVPPVYRSNNGQEFPVFFRALKDELVVALHKGIFQFIRIQTSSGVKSYSALGRKSLQKKVLEIDKELAEIENSYQFLWLISPANIRQIKETFFKTSHEKVLNYHYRLLPFDPDVLKRRLYNLQLEDIDDPALSYIFRQKREELDLQISMLTTRGSKEFFYNSMMLYGPIEDELLQEAENLLNQVKEVEEKEQQSVMKARDFAILAEKEFEYFKKQAPDFSSKIHIRNDVNILMVSQGEVYIPQDFKLNVNETKALIQHEIGTHVLTFFNGAKQPLKLLSVGLTDYDTLQEGLAVFSEYLVGGLTSNRMRTLAGRVVAASTRMHGADFTETFNLLFSEYHFDPQRAFNITSRIFQGGGFTKDISYLKGVHALVDHLKEGGNLESLLTGKFALEHLDIIQELRDRRVLIQPSILPRYLNTSTTEKKLNQIRGEFPLSKMID